MIAPAPFPFSNVTLVSLPAMWLKGAPSELN